MVDFTTRLKELRKEYGLTQAELAGRIGAKRGTIAAWEVGRMPERQAVEKLADVFGSTTDYMLGRSSQRYKQDDSPPTTTDIEELLRKPNIMFEGEPLDDEDIAIVTKLVIVTLKVLKKRNTQQIKATE